MRLFLLGVVLGVLAGAQDRADLVITNARVWTANAKQPWADSVAIRGERIVAVGNARSLAGERTKVIDAGGKLVVPGFNDAHIHFLGGSQRLFRVDLTGACTLQAIQERIANWARENPSAPWVNGGGWEYYCFPGQRLPTKEDLDAVVKDRPAYLSAYDGHTAWVNSKALEIADINKATKFDGFGEIVRDASGVPTGALKEGAMGLVSKHIPADTRERKVEALDRGLKLAASLGITSLQNAHGSRDELAMYEEFLKQGKLTARVSFAMSVGPSGKGCAGLADLKGRHPGPWIRAAAVKFMIDGVIESHTASMLEPYSDDPSTTGQLNWKEDEYKRAVATCGDLGWQPYTHAIGDRGVRLSLDAYEPFRGRDVRARIEHIETVQPADIPRFGKLGVLASFMPIHADPATINVWSKAVGEKRLPWSFAWRALEDAGATLVFSSDWPASISVDPIRGLHNAVNRQTIEGAPPGGWLPQHRVTLESALRAYTINAAYASFEEKAKGSIEPGKLADLVILSQDLFAIAPADIHKTRVVTTVVGGRVVYSSLN
jgi:hypothetical protein